MPLALFRCDASPTVGAGHVSRCLAVAEALREAGWQVRLVVGPDTVATMPDVAAYEPHVLTATADELHAMRSAAGEGADLVVVDHYGREAAFEAACHPLTRKVVVFDDMTGRNHDCDLLIDAAASGPEQYRGRIPEHARVLAGPAYTIVRKSFIAARQAALAQRDGRPVKNVLVSCGATDPANVTAAALDALSGLPLDISVTVVLSSKAPHVGAVRRKLRSGMTLITDAENMAELMTAADLAIGVPGATSYERAILGLPSMVVTVADNQRGIAAMIIKAGASLDAGAPDAGLSGRLRELTTRLLRDSELRIRLAHAAAALADGRGATRLLLRCLGSVFIGDGTPVRLRLAETIDEGWLLELQRQPETRRFARDQAVSTAEEHHKWMERTLVDHDRVLCIVEAAGEPVGALRLDRLNSQAGLPRYEISIAVESAHHNRGVAKAALMLARAMRPNAIIDATVLAGNVASERLFTKSGYARMPDSLFRSMPVQSGLAEVPTFLT